MDLELSAEQQMLRDAVAGLAATYGDPDRLRELEDDPVGFDRTCWQELASMDLIGLTLPAAHGGSEMGALESMVVFQELGRAIVPTPLLVSAVIGGGVLAAAGSEQLQAAWLPRIARGEAIVTLAWHESGRSDRVEGVVLPARADGDEIDGQQDRGALRVVGGRLRGPGPRGRRRQPRAGRGGPRGHHDGADHGGGLVRPVRGAPTSGSPWATASATPARLGTPSST